jgi:beta-phosphoglucomutase-like phosphatase (HAD superfamily)
MLELPPGDFDAYIFDCDGTLVDSMSLHHRAWRSALAEAGALFDFSWEVFVSRAGMGLPETVLELNRQFKANLQPDVVIHSQRQHFERLMPELGIVDAVVAVAKASHGKLPMSVASGGEKRIVLRSLELVGLLPFFDPVVCRDDVVRGKPDPEMFLLCAERMGVAPERCLVFEDGEMGILAAASAGMQCVRVILPPPQ